MELLFRKKINRLEVLGRHVWIAQNTQQELLLERKINQQLPERKIQRNNPFENQLESEFELQLDKELNHELQTLLKDLLEKEMKIIAKNLTDQLLQKQSESLLANSIPATPKKAREIRITAQSAAGGVNK